MAVGAGREVIPGVAATGSMVGEAMVGGTAVGEGTGMLVVVGAGSGVSVAMETGSKAASCVVGAEMGAGAGAVQPAMIAMQVITDNIKEQALQVIP